MLLFSTFGFLIYSFIVVIIYYVITEKHRMLWLLASSYFFYLTYSVQGVAILFILTLFTFITAKMIFYRPACKKRILFFSISILILVLFGFKYLNFFYRILVNVVQLFSPSHLEGQQAKVFNILIPVGISFYIFQSMGYLIGVYKHKVPIEENFIYYALFLSYFPKLISGPIEKAELLLPQLKEDHPATYENVTTGLRWLLLGYFKKIVLADTLAVYVNQVYVDVTKFTGLSLIAVMFLFSIQIYCDFSGYSDIAVGISKVMGIDLTINFKSPYFSESIIEFWKRWHISLTDWFRENLYIPLGGSRVSYIRHMMNILFVFFISGLWHGANYTYILWGGLHGILQCIEVSLKKGSCLYLTNQKKFLKNCSCFIVVSIVWIFFRADNLSDAMYVVTHLLAGFEFNYLYIANSLTAIGFQKITLLFTIINLIILFWIDYLNYKECIVDIISNQATVLRWTIYILLGYMILFAMMFTSQSQNFVYFQF